MKGFEAGTSLLSCCGDEKPSSTKVVPYPGEEMRDCEALIVHPIVAMKKLCCLIRCLQIGWFRK